MLWFPPPPFQIHLVLLICMGTSSISSIVSLNKPNLAFSLSQKPSVKGGASWALPNPWAGPVLRVTAILSSCRLQILVCCFTFLDAELGKALRTRTLPLAFTVIFLIRILISQLRVLVWETDTQLSNSPRVSQRSARTLLGGFIFRASFVYSSTPTCISAAVTEERASFS